MNDDIKDFPHPIGVDIVEQTPVQKIDVEFNDKGIPKTSIKTVMQKSLVRYIHAPKDKIRCAPGQHFWGHYNKKQWLFGCSKCRFVIRVFPSTHTVDLTAGTIQNKASGRFL